MKSKFELKFDAIFNWVEEGRKELDSLNWSRLGELGLLLLLILCLPFMLPVAAVGHLIKWLRRCMKSDKPENGES